MHRVGHGARAGLAILLIVGGATAGTLLAGSRGGAAPKPAPGLRANILPRALDGAPAPRIRLADQRGRTLDSAGLGRPYVVTFLYTHCTDVCPVIGAEIADALGRLGARAEGVAALGVSVDPRGDTPARARAWAAERGLPSEFHYLLGSTDQLAPVWQDWYVVADGRGLDDPRTHGASVWLVDARDRLRGRWSGGEAIPPADIAHDLGVLLDEAHQHAASGRGSAQPSPAR
jgi:protein SCO1/2